MNFYFVILKVSLIKLTRTLSEMLLAPSSRLHKSMSEARLLFACNELTYALSDTLLFVAQHCCYLLLIKTSLPLASPSSSSRFHSLIFPFLSEVLSPYNFPTRTLSFYVVRCSFYKACKKVSEFAYFSGKYLRGLAIMFSLFFLFFVS